jgi:hypothetical protein
MLYSNLLKKVAVIFMLPLYVQPGLTLWRESLGFVISCACKPLTLLTHILSIIEDSLEGWAFAY